MCVKISKPQKTTQTFCTRIFEQKNSWITICVYVCMHACVSDFQIFDEIYNPLFRFWARSQPRRNQTFNDMWVFPQRVWGLWFYQESLLCRSGWGRQTLRSKSAISGNEYVSLLYLTWSAYLMDLLTTTIDTGANGCHGYCWAYRALLQCLAYTCTKYGWCMWVFRQYDFTEFFPPLPLIRFVYYKVCVCYTCKGPV